LGGLNVREGERDRETHHAEETRRHAPNPHPVAALRIGLHGVPASVAACPFPPTGKGDCRVDAEPKHLESAEFRPTVVAWRSTRLPGRCGGGNMPIERGTRDA